MNPIIKAAGKAAMKAATVYYAQKLMRPHNLKKIGIGFGVVLGVSVGYAAYRILSENEQEDEE